MAETHDDYVWDHTGEHLDDDSPLLDDNTRVGGSFFYSFSRQDSNRDASHSRKITKLQAEQMLRTFEDGAALIRGQLLAEPVTNESVETQGSQCLQCRRLTYFFERCSFIFTLLLQIANIIILSLLDHYFDEPKTKTDIAAGEIVMLILELLNLALIILTSVKLGQQMYHRRVNGYFLAQCYLSSILLFAGLYALTYRLYRKSWRFVEESEVIVQEPLLIVFLFLKMLYLSVSTATLCGSAVITPREWYNYVLMGLQMILSFVAFASILGQMFSYGAGPDRVRKSPPYFRQRRPSIESQASRISVASYGALDSTQPLIPPTHGNHINS